LDLPGYDTLVDLVGNPLQSDFNAFFNGNQFMVLPDLFRAFRQNFPEYGSIFYETLPPGLLADQIEQQGRLDVGSLQLQVLPDIFAAGQSEMHSLSKYLDAPQPYAQNQLALLLPKDNPAHVTTLTDLGVSSVRVLMPNPQTEGIARLARKALQMTGYPHLDDDVFKNKVLKGETVFTAVHHRETVDQIEQCHFDVGVVWISEALYAVAQGRKLRWLPFPERADPVGRYYIAGLKNAPHPAAQKHFLQFIGSAEAQKIYTHYGFEPPDQKEAFSGF
jgi:ABC-type molybdate transport system substrate-binding protein